MLYATLNSLTCSTSYLDGVLTYKYTPTTTSYYIRCSLYLNINGEYFDVGSYDNGTPHDIYQKSKTTQLDASQLTNIYSKLPNSTVATLRMELQTYSDAFYSTEVGDSSYADIKLTIPQSVKPQIGEITLTPATIKIGDEYVGYLIKGKNRLSLSVSGSTAGSGSTIKSYTFYGPSLYETTTKASTSVAAVTNVDSDLFVNDIATLTYTVTATDTRNRVSEPKTQTIRCNDYNTPYFQSFNVVRNGSNLSCEYIPVFHPLDDKNVAKVEICYTIGNITNVEVISDFENGASKKTNIDLNNNDATCQVYAVISDGLGESLKTPTKTLYGDSRIMNVMRDGDGIAFGKKAETKDMLESKWPIKANGFVIPEIQRGSTTMQLESNKQTPVEVNFELEFSGVPTVIVTPQIKEPGQTIINTVVSDVDSKGCKIWTHSTNATKVDVNWIAIF